MRERKPGQDGQTGRYPFPANFWVDPRTERGYRIVNLARVLGEGSSTDPSQDAYPNPSATLGADTPGRGRSTSPRIPPVDSP